MEQEPRRPPPQGSVLQSSSPFDDLDAADDPASKMTWARPEGFDVFQSTKENFAAQGGLAESFGAFATIRESLDFGKADACPSLAGDALSFQCSSSSCRVPRLLCREPPAPAGSADHERDRGRVGEGAPLDRFHRRGHGRWQR